MTDETATLALAAIVLLFIGACLYVGAFMGLGLDRKAVEAMKIETERERQRMIRRRTPARPAAPTIEGAKYCLLREGEK